MEDKMSLTQMAEKMFGILGEIKDLLTKKPAKKRATKKVSKKSPRKK